MTQENSLMLSVSDKNMDTSNYANPDSPSSCKRIKLEESKKRWTNEEVIRLIELFEERTILWNVFDKDYSKRDKFERDVAFNDISKELNTPVLDIKAKLSTLRAQLGRELKKVKSKPKNGQPIDELHQSSWAYWKLLQFLAPVMLQTSKNRQDMISIEVSMQNNTTDDNIFSCEDELATMIPHPKMEGTISESDDDTMPSANEHQPMVDHRKVASVTDCAFSITSPIPIATAAEITTPPSSVASETPKRTVSHFAAYVDEKLGSFDRRNRAIVEKRITDILFEMEMSSTPESNCACSHCQQNPQDSHDTTYSNYRS